nr:hypothetical protein [Rodentibacter myodis]
MKKLTALLFIVTVILTNSSCSKASFREEFFKQRPCAEVKYRCLPENQEKTMIDTSKPYVLSAEEWTRIEQDKTLRMYKEISQMLEIYYPGFWKDVTDEQVKINWVEKADKLTKKYVGNDRFRGDLEEMTQICAIIGLGFEMDPKFKFIVNRFQKNDVFALSNILDYLRFEVLKKDFDTGGTHYNTWSLRGVQENMPPITRHIPDFYTENKPANPKENVRKIYENTILVRGK